MANVARLVQRKACGAVSAGGVLLVLAVSSATSGAQPSSGPAAVEYEILIDARRPAEAEVRLSLSAPPARLVPARDGDGRNIAGLRCDDGRPGLPSGNAWMPPAGCTRFAWNVALADIDAAGLDASLPGAAYSLRHAYWLIPERDGLLRASNDGGRLSMRLRLGDGRTVERRYHFPSNDQPPFYGVAGTRPSREYRRDAFTLRVFGDPPDFPWMDAIHGDVLESWARWRRDLAGHVAPERVDWAWVRPPENLEPGYNASAGAEAIVSQIRLRSGDPDAEAKARAVIATSAAHEGFHTITGAAGQAWPAWVNESLASHYAIAAARTFLSAEDQRWLDAFYVAPEVPAPLLDAQARYTAGDGDQAQVFYIYGARFWREIEKVLTNAPSGSGRLAALMRGSDNFAGIDLNDADAVAIFFDRHSEGQAGEIVRCFLRGTGCAAPNGAVRRGSG